MALFSFSVNAFQISDTRSAHNDTDYVSLCVKVNNNLPLVAVARVGDVNNGNHQVNLAIQGVTVNQPDTVAVNYLIVNAGSTTLANAQSPLGSTAALIVEGPTGPAGRLPQPGSALSALYNFLNTHLQGIFKPGSCDGPVAAECGIFSYASLLSKVPFQENTNHLGIKPTSGGCNARVSNYTTSWSMLQVTRVPLVKEMSLKQADDTLQAAMLNGRPSGSGPVVVQQSPPENQFAGLNSDVTLVMGVAP
jgi:hypothetical protein